MSKTTQKSGGRRRAMRRDQSFRPSLILVVFGGLALVAGALFAIWKSGQPPRITIPVEVEGSPGLTVDRDTVDLGDVPLDKTVTVTFQLANVGDETLRFTAEPFIEVVEGC